MTNNIMEKKNMVLTLDELDSVSGGDMAMWRALDVIFNCAERWRSFDDLEVCFTHRCQIYNKVLRLTGIEINPNCVLAPDRDLTFTMSDGTELSEEQFLDYVKATYPMDEILSWHSI